MSTNFKNRESESFQKLMNHSMQSNHTQGKYINISEIKFCCIYR